MTAAQQQKRVEEAAIVLSEIFGGRAERVIDAASKALDAADRAVPVLSEDDALLRFADTLTRQQVQTALASVKEAERAAHAFAKVLANRNEWGAGFEQQVQAVLCEHPGWGP